MFMLRALILTIASNTPFTPSKYRGAGSIRVCTTVRFKLYPGTTEERLVPVINIHLDDQSDAQRQLGASMLRMRARFEAAKYGPVVLAGDFNRYLEMQ
jgi:endonuclease/exonuclease/phosphatase family metal-dependent hydrolase